MPPLTSAPVRRRHSHTAGGDTELTVVANLELAATDGRAAREGVRASQDQIAETDLVEREIADQIRADGHVVDWQGAADRHIEHERTIDRCGARVRPGKNCNRPAGRHGLEGALQIRKRIDAEGAGLISRNGWIRISDVPGPGRIDVNRPGNNRAYVRDRDGEILRIAQDR